MFTSSFGHAAGDYRQYRARALSGSGAPVDAPTPSAPMDRGAGTAPRFAWPMVLIVSLGLQAGTSVANAAPPLTMDTAATSGLTTNEPAADAAAAWSWHARCDPAGTQLELTACAHVEQIKAEQALNAIRAMLAELYQDDPEVLAEKTARFDAIQSRWESQLQRDLDALFPLAPGDNPAVLYGSSYAMQYAYARAFLIRQRTDFLRTFWLP